MSAPGDELENQRPPQAAPRHRIPTVVISEPTTPQHDFDMSEGAAKPDPSDAHANGLPRKSEDDPASPDEVGSLGESESVFPASQLQADIDGIGSFMSLNDNDAVGGGAMLEVIPRPPDGGYGWIIVAAAFFSNFIVDGVCNSFSGLKKSFQEHFNCSETVTALIGSILVASYLLIGPFVGGFINKFGARPIVCAGSLVAGAAFALSTYAANIPIFVFLFGVVGGIGYGMIYLPAIVYVGFYFESKRAIATGIAVAGSGVGTMVMPILVDHLIANLGWKGTVFLISGFSLLCLPLGFLYKPLEAPKQIAAEDEQKGDVEMELLKAKLREFDSDDSTEASVEGQQPPRRQLSYKSKTNEWIDANSKQGTGMSPEEDDEVMARLRSALSECEGDTASDAKETNGEVNRTQLSPITEHSTSKQRSSTNVQNAPPVSGGSNQRTRKLTMTSMTSDMMFSSESKSNLGSSRANLTSGLARVSARSFAQSLSRLSARGVGTTGQSMLSVAMSGVDPKEFAKPMNRKDIFYAGSIANLKEFADEGSSMPAYRESILSIPASVISRAASKISVAGDLADANLRMGGSRMSRFTGGLGPEDADFVETYYDDSRFKFIPLTIRNVLSEMIDIQLLKDKIMLLLCISNLFGMMAFYIPFVYLKNLAVEGEVDESLAGYLVPIIGFTNTFGRIFFGWMADRRFVSALTINNVSLLSCGVLTAAAPFMPGFAGLVAYSSLFGFMISAYISLTSIVLSDLLGLEKLTNSFGLLVVARGIASLAGSPFAGFVYDETKSYAASFFMGGGLIVLAGIISCAIPFAARYQRSRGDNEGEERKDEDAMSGKLSVLTERSEENLTEYQRTIQSLRQQHALLREVETEKGRIAALRNDDARIGEAEDESDEVTDAKTALLDTAAENGQAEQAK